LIQFCDDVSTGSLKRFKSQLMLNLISSKKGNLIYFEVKYKDELETSAFVYINDIDVHVVQLIDELNQDIDRNKEAALELENSLKNT